MSQVHAIEITNGGDAAPVSGPEIVEAADDVHNLAGTGWMKAMVRGTDYSLAEWLWRNAIPRQITSHQFIPPQRVAPTGPSLRAPRLTLAFLGKCEHWHGVIRAHKRRYLQTLTPSSCLRKDAYLAAPGLSLN